MIARLTEELESLGHLEVLEGLPVLDGTLREPLGWRAASCFRGMRLEALKGLCERLKSLSPGPRKAEFLALRGRVQWLLGRNAQALRDLNAALELQPKNPSALGYLGAFWARRRPRTAVGYCRRALSAGGQAWPALWSAAARLAGPRRAEWSRALGDLDYFLDRSSVGEVPARLLKGMACLRLGRAESARGEADRLIAREPLLCAGYGLRSAARWALGDREGAFSDAHLSRDRDPNGGFSVADSLLSRADWADEGDHLRLLDEAIASQPRQAFLFAERAEALRSGGSPRFSDALEDYRRAQALEPDRAWLEAQMARAEGQVLGIGKGLARLDKAVALFPRGGWIRAWRGEARRLGGGGVEALEDFDAAILLMPWYGYAYAWKGAWLAGRGLWGEALPCLERAVAMEPTYPTDVLARASLARAHRELGDREAFRRELGKAARLDPKNRLVQELMGRTAGEVVA